MSHRHPRLLPLLLLTLPLTGCLRFGYGVTHFEAPLDQAALHGLRPGVDDLGSCLQKLGAPNHVFEYQGSGLAIAWHWSDGSDLDLDISYSFSKELSSASFSLDLDDLSIPGAVLWFDADWKLLSWREGNMRDIASGLRRRTAPADDDAR